MNKMKRYISLVLCTLMVIGVFSFYIGSHDSRVYADDAAADSIPIVERNEEKINENKEKLDKGLDDFTKEEAKKAKSTESYNVNASLLSTSDSTIKISWETLDEYTTYKIYWCDKKDGEYKLLQSVTGNNYTHSKLKIGVKYYYKVIPSGIEDEEAALINEQSYVCTPVPKSPATVKLKNFISYAVKVSWSKVSGVDGYKIYFSKDGQNYTWLKTLGNTKTSYIKSKLKDKTVYHFKVVPYKKIGDKHVKATGTVKKITATKKSYVTIMLDPGHRGKESNGYIDYGAIGYDRKTREADLNDKFAVELRKQLKAAGYNVVYSRTPYKVSPYKSLRGLTKAANKKKPDLFISIHHNASSNRSAKGYSIWYSTYKRGLDSDGLYAYIFSKKYNYGRTKYKVIKEIYSTKGIKLYVRRKGKTEVVSSRKTRYYLRDSTPTTTGKNSRKLAKLTQTEFGKAKVLKRWGNKGYIDADFAVLVNTRMPSMMLEVGFVSNKKELKKLKKKSTRQKYSKSVVKSVNKYYGL